MRRTRDFQSIRSEGGLLPPDLLRRVIDPKEKIPGTSPEAFGLPRGDRINETITHSWNRLRRHWDEFRGAAKSLPEGEAGHRVLKAYSHMGRERHFFPREAPGLFVRASRPNKQSVWVCVGLPGRLVPS